MRPLIASIRLEHFRHNYELARRQHGGRALAVVKANAYGHGAVRCAQAVADIADGYAVACLEEALQLREAGLTLPILLLEGVFEAAELREVEQHGLWLVVQSQQQLDMLLASQPAKPYRVWLKMDSGMHRAGFFPQDYAAAYQRLAESGKVDGIVKMTHFARADEPALSATAQQMETFDAACAGLPGEVSVANSAAIMVHERTRRDWGRPGIMLYGATPLPAGYAQDAALKPVMRLTSRVFGVRELAAGEPVGYGATFVTERPSRVGLIACGYADGYPRLASTGSPVAIDGVRSRIIGRVSMDMITVDLTDLPAAGIGSEVELWGDSVNVNEVAAQAGTIAYELLCNVKRAHFVYC
ncbi:alanine racemase [Pseudogulbenkiania sp. NH8B]|uniref:alanine racemase n=1 Tax=Pseudogulbenkiania sp. (strain NH8B) TaxID=748280 RepID=UPI0002279CC5|nr:alanine racemase [Pseudogulbenkiania sp. NH8B]BAK75968.1 alanine racemase [Pseudogulbenkiania sp. NH8B]